MRTGKEYQAEIPEFLSDVHIGFSKSDHATLLWTPNNNSLDHKVDLFISIATTKFSYNIEQCLGLLLWHKYDTDKAVADLPNFTPHPDMWSIEDKIIFEQAFHLHGKHFGLIQLMIPDKSVGELIKYYYTWKKTLSQTSDLGRSRSKKGASRDDDLLEGSDSDFESTKSAAVKLTTDNKTSTAILSGVTNDENLSAQSVNKKGDVRLRPRTKCKPPKSMCIDYNDLMAAISGQTGVSLPGENIVKPIESQVTALKRQVQGDKQHICSFKQKHNFDITAFRPPASQTELQSYWTTRELLLAVEGIRCYGKNFDAIAETLGSKTESQVRDFFASCHDRFNLEAALKDFEEKNCKNNTVNLHKTLPVGTQLLLGAEVSLSNLSSHGSTITRHTTSSSLPPPLHRQSPQSHHISAHNTASSSQPPTLQHANKDVPQGSSRPSLHQPPPLFRQSVSVVPSSDTVSVPYGIGIR